MGVLGVPTGEKGQPRDRVLIDAHQPGGLPDAAPLGEVLQDRQDFVMRQLGVEKRRPLELREPILTSLAVEQPVAEPAEVIDDEEIVPAPLAVQFAIGILAAEVGEVVRGHDAS